MCVLETETFCSPASGTFSPWWRSRVSCSHVKCCGAEESKSVGWAAELVVARLHLSVLPDGTLFNAVATTLLYYQPHQLVAALHFCLTVSAFAFGSPQDFDALSSSVRAVFMTCLLIITLVLVVRKLVLLHQSRLLEVTYILVFYLAAVEIFLMILKTAFFVNIILHFVALYLHVNEVGNDLLQFLSVFSFVFVFVLVHPPSLYPLLLCSGSIANKSCST